MSGFTSFPRFAEPDKVRGKPEKFADHYTQATLFYRSQAPVEQAHIQRALRFELTKVQVPAVRERVVAMLRNIDEKLAARVAGDLGMELPDALPRAIARVPKPEVAESPALSLFARPGDGSIRTRRVAILVATGSDLGHAVELHERLTELGAIPRYVANVLGTVVGAKGDSVESEVTFETMPSVLVDAVAVPCGERAAKALANVGQAVESIVNAYRHCKPILAWGAGRSLVENCGVPATLPAGDPDPGLLLVETADFDDGVEGFVAAIARHRHFERQVDPPAV
ncbi:MAG TPA: catalase-related domain-containing protein [Steroidobacteraceae bacterium]|nr:catalase-related domain-containing protein [Steroidobacteraceae bacterium]